MCANDFNYNEFTKLMDIKNTCDDVFDYAMWAYYRLELRVDVESMFLNNLRGRISHLLKKISKYSCYELSLVDIAVNILLKTDIKRMYKYHFGKVSDIYMSGYMRCKTFCNKLRVYLSGLVYDICYFTGYDDVNCREVDARIFNDLKEVLHEC